MTKNPAIDAAYDAALSGAQERIVALETRVQELIAEKGDLAVENTQLRAALQKLLDLDEQRPMDPTWWRKWWDEARAEAETLLGGAPKKKKDSHS